jgi:cytochrome c biogenesis protein CcdA
VAQIGGVIVVIFGLHTLGLVKIPFLYYDTRRHYHSRPELGYLSSALMGFFFGTGWSPCVGSTLGAILTLVLSEATVGQGALLLLVCSMGRQSLPVHRAGHRSDIMTKPSLYPPNGGCKDRPDIAGWRAVGVI